MQVEQSREMAMQEIWKTFSVPIIVSLVGLVFVAGLGVAPLIGRNAPAPAQAAPAPQASPVVVAELDPGLAESLRADMARQAQALDSLTNRLTTLEKGITRLNQKLATQGDQLESLSDLPGQVNRLSGEAAILNKAVPRINARILDQAAAFEAVPAIQGQVGTLEGQMRIVNAAIPKINARVKAQSDLTQSVPEMRAQLATLEGQMRIINSAVPKMQARIVALREALESD